MSNNNQKNYSLNLNQFLSEAVLNPQLVGPTLPPIPPFTLPTGSTGLTGPTGSTGPTGPNFPNTTAVLNKTTAQSFVANTNVIFNNFLNLNNILFNGIDTLQIINSGIYLISFSATTTFPGVSPFGFGISINNKVPIDNLVTNAQGSLIAFTTLENLLAGDTISIKATNVINIPSVSTNETTAKLAIVRIQ